MGLIYVIDYFSLVTLSSIKCKLCRSFNTWDWNFLMRAVFKIRWLHWGMIALVFVGCELWQQITLHIWHRVDWVERCVPKSKICDINKRCLLHSVRCKSIQMSWAFYIKWIECFKWLDVVSKWFMLHFSFPRRWKCMESISDEKNEIFMK